MEPITRPESSKTPARRNWPRTAAVAWIVLAPCLLGCAITRSHRSHQKLVERTGAAAVRDLAALAEAHARDPADVGVAIALAKAHLSESDARSATDVLAVTTNVNPAEPAMGLLARIDPDAAAGADCAQRALELYPNSRSAYVALLQRLLELDSHGLLLEWVNRWPRFYKFGDESVAIHQTIAEAYAELGMLGQAVEWTEATLEARLDATGRIHAADVEQLARLYDGSERWPEASARLRQLAVGYESSEPEMRRWSRSIGLSRGARRPRPLDERADLGFAWEAGPSGPVITSVRGLKDGSSKLRPGDVLLRIDGETVRGNPTRVALEESVEAGEVAELTIDRSGDAVRVSVIPRTRLESAREAMAELDAAHQLETSQGFQAPANLLARRSHLSRAASLLQHDGPRTRERLALANRGLGRHANVIEAASRTSSVETLLETDPYSSALHELAFYESGAASPKDAIADVLRVQQLVPDSGWWVAVEGLYHCEGQDWEKAAASLRRSILLGGIDSSPACERYPSYRKVSPALQLARKLDSRDKAAYEGSWIGKVVQGWNEFIESGGSGAAGSSYERRRSSYRDSQAGQEYTRTMYATGL